MIEFLILKILRSRWITISRPSYEEGARTTRMKYTKNEPHHPWVHVWAGPEKVKKPGSLHSYSKCTWSDKYSPLFSGNYVVNRILLMTSQKINGITRINYITQSSDYIGVIIMILSVILENNSWVHLSQKRMGERSAEIYLVGQGGNIFTS